MGVPKWQCVGVLSPRRCLIFPEFWLKIAWRVFPRTFSSLFLKYSKIRATSNSEWIGVDAMGSGQENMKKANVIEGLRQKCQQILLADDLAQMIIKIDSIRIVSLDE